MTDLAALMIVLSGPLLLGNYLMMTSEAFSDGTLATGDAFPRQIVEQGKARVFISSFVALLIVSAVGLYSAKLAGLSPLQITATDEALLIRVVRILGIGVVAGFFASVAFDGLRIALFRPYLKSWDEDVRFSRWRPFLGAAIWAGIVEELLFRLVGLSFFAFAFSYVWPNADGNPSSMAFWIANVIISLIMAASHITLIGSEIPYTFWNAAKWVFLVSVVSMSLGYVYWHHGFETSAVCHGATILFGWFYGSAWKWIRAEPPQGEAASESREDGPAP